MSHLRHRRFYKKPPRGPIFIDGSIVTKVCYSISPLASRICIKKTCEKCQQILSRKNFKAASNFMQSRDIKTV